MAGSPIPATGIGWNTDIPDDGQVHGNDYVEHRETKLAVSLRLAKEHVAFGVDSAGCEHKEGSANIYCGDYSSAAAGDALPTTKPDGATALDTNDKGRLAYDTDDVYGGLFYKWSGTAWVQVPLVALTGTQTIAGVKTFSSIPVLPASDPTTANQATRKSYVDARTPTYAGEESITLGGGLIIKMGFKAASSTPATVTFAVAFPNACISAIVSESLVGQAVDDHYPAIMTTKVSATAFIVACLRFTDANSGFYWIAIGW
jgi:hypothetical protein